MAQSATAAKTIKGQLLGALIKKALHTSGVTIPLNMRKQDTLRCLY